MLADQNTKVYLPLLKKIALVVGYTFGASLKRSSRLGSSKQMVGEAQSSPFIREDCKLSEENSINIYCCKMKTDLEALGKSYLLSR